VPILSLLLSSLPHKCIKAYLSMTAEIRLRISICVNLFTNLQKNLVLTTAINKNENMYNQEGEAECYDGINVICRYRMVI
jgi:hypothetical protein